jgi:hypothetical protein
MLTPSEKCEMCELLLATYVTGVEQQLSCAMYVDRAFRFGGDFDDAVRTFNALRPEVEQALANFGNTLKLP